MLKLCLVTNYCKVLREIPTIQKSKTRPPLNKRYEPKRLIWVRKYEKMDFSSLAFTNNFRGTLVGPDELAKCWIFFHHCLPFRILHQQGRGEVIFWPAIIDDGSIRPFRIENDVKIDSWCYYALLDKHFLSS